MALPPFTPNNVLPPGGYPMTLDELRRSFLVTGAGSQSETWDYAWRETLVMSLGVLVRQLWQVGIDRIFVDGSFAENKDHPNDIDGYFETEEEGVITGRLVEELNALDHTKLGRGTHGDAGRTRRVSNRSSRCGTSTG